MKELGLKSVSFSSYFTVSQNNGENLSYSKTGPYFTVLIVNPGRKTEELRGTVIRESESVWLPERGTAQEANFELEIPKSSK